LQIISKWSRGQEKADVRGVGRNTGVRSVVEHKSGASLGGGVRRGGLVGRSGRYFHYNHTQLELKPVKIDV
jgi:hypothetical protein